MGEHMVASCGQRVGRCWSKDLILLVVMLPFLCEVGWAQREGHDSSGTFSVLNQAQGVREPPSRHALASLRMGRLAPRLGPYWPRADENGFAAGFGLLLPATEDEAIIPPSSWWTLERAFHLLGFTGLLILLGALWVLMLRRRVQNQTETIRATLESSRGWNRGC